MLGNSLIAVNQVPSLSCCPGSIPGTTTIEDQGYSDKTEARANSDESLPRPSWECVRACALLAVAYEGS